MKLGEGEHGESPETLAIFSIEDVQPGPMSQPFPRRGSKAVLMKILGYYVDLEGFLPVLVLASQEERKTSRYPRKVACESVLQEIKASNTWATCRMQVVEGPSVLLSFCLLLTSPLNWVSWEILLARTL